MTSRKFYRTKISVEILSEDPVSFDNLAAVHQSITDGDCSGVWDVINVDELDGKQAASALSAQGSDPTFFRINEKGEDLD